MSKHYPGPYEVRGNGDEEQFVIFTTDGLHEVAMVNGFEDGDPRNAVRLANANLLAAAPEMLEALKTIGGFIYRNMRKNNDEGWAAYSQIIAAIAKAEGTR